MDAMQSADLEPVLDRLSTEPEFAQLVVSDYPVLPSAESPHFARLDS
jgi:hypothetical protein